jgi:hypothetical protein
MVPHCTYTAPSATMTVLQVPPENPGRARHMHQRGMWQGPQDADLLLVTAPCLPSSRASALTVLPPLQQDVPEEQARRRRHGRQLIRQMGVSVLPRLLRSGLLALLQLRAVQEQGKAQPASSVML